MWIDFKFKAGNNVVGFIEKKRKKFLWTVIGWLSFLAFWKCALRTQKWNETIDINIYSWNIMF